MTWLTDFVRYLDVVNDPVLQHPETISGLPPYALRQAEETLAYNGWIKTFEYEGEDAWIDYARVDMRNGRTKLRLEWDPDAGGSVEAPRAVLDDLRVLDPWVHMQHGLH
jgi:hypothetical protein